MGRLALAKGIVGTLALGSILLSLVETDAVGKGARNLLDKLCNVYAILLGLFVFSVITAGMLILGAIKVRVINEIDYCITEIITKTLTSTHSVALTLSSPIW